MDAFHFIDIFSTKGIEYILVISFMVMFLIFWKLLNKPAAVTKSGQPVFSRKFITQSGFRIAEDYYYHPGHSWFSIDKNNEVKTGMDEFASKLLGDPDDILLPSKNDIVKQGDKAWVIKKDGKSIDMLSPVSGRVVEINNSVLDNPSVIGDSPYENGWLYKVEPDDLKRNIKNMLKGNYARVWLEEAVNSLTVRFTGKLGLVLQDGGIPAEGIAREIDSENWDKIAGEYFLSS